MNENDDPTRDDGVRIILHGNKKTKKTKKKLRIIFLSGLFSLHLRHQIKYNTLIN